METLYDPNQTTNDLAGILYGSKGEAIGQIEAEAESLYWQAEEICYHAAMSGNWRKICLIYLLGFTA